MTTFDKWNEKYKKNWCTKDQLGRLVALEVLSEEQYEEITGEKLED